MEKTRDCSTGFETGCKPVLFEVDSWKNSATKNKKATKFNLMFLKYKFEAVQHSELESIILCTVKMNKFCLF